MGSSWSLGLVLVPTSVADAASPPQKRGLFCCRTSLSWRLAFGPDDVGPTKISATIKEGHDGAASTSTCFTLAHLILRCRSNHAIISFNPSKMDEKSILAREKLSDFEEDEPRARWRQRVEQWMEEGLLTRGHCNVSTIVYFFSTNVAVHV